MYAIVRMRIMTWTESMRGLRTGSTKKMRGDASTGNFAECKDPSRTLPQLSSLSGLIRVPRNVRIPGTGTRRS